MRKLVTVLALMLASATPALAQDTSHVLVSKSTLTKEQLAQVQSQQQTKEIADKVETAGKFVGIGKEIGEAVNSSLSAVTDNAAKFADTKVGRFTMFIVIWKVIGKDIMGIGWGLLLVLIGVPCVIWSYRKWSSDVRLDKEDLDDKGKVVARHYRELTFTESNERAAAGILHGFAMFAIMIATAIAVFG